MAKLIRKIICLRRKKVWQDWFRLLIQGTKGPADESQAWQKDWNPFEFQFQSAADYKGKQTIQFGRSFGKFSFNNLFVLLRKRSIK